MTARPSAHESDHEGTRRHYAGKCGEADCIAHSFGEDADGNVVRVVPPDPKSPRQGGVDYCWELPGHRGDHWSDDPAGPFPRRADDTCAPEGLIVDKPVESVENVEDPCG